MLTDLETKIKILKHNFRILNSDDDEVSAHIYTILSHDILFFLQTEAAKNQPIWDQESADFIELFNFLYNHKIIGLITEGEAKALYFLAQAMKNNQEPIIEIGAHLGFSTIFLAKHKLVQTIDNQFNDKLREADPLWRIFFANFYNDEFLFADIRDHETKLEICRRHWRLAGFFANIKTICGEAKEAAALMPRASMVFYDADHDYKSVHDLDAYFSKIVSHGVIAIHDFNEKTPGVIGAVYDFYLRNKVKLDGPFLIDSLIWFRVK